MIQNTEELSFTQRRSDALRIIEEGIESVEPKKLMEKALCYNKAQERLSINNSSFDLKGKRIFVIGGGKATGDMAKVIEDMFGTERITAGTVTATQDRGTKKIHTVIGGHPTPDQAGLSAVQEIFDLKKKYEIGEQDIIIALISGGGSSLLPSPIGTITLEDQKRCTKLLLKCGADIREINTVRGHISKVKGGRLANHFQPATIISLIISDVVGDAIESIASGPTVIDPSTYEDALQVIKHHRLRKRIPSSILRHLEAGTLGAHDDTPRTLDQTHNFLIGDNYVALTAMAKKAKSIGYNPFIITSEQRGEPRVAARNHAREIKSGRYHHYDCLLIGGETTPVIPETHGKGGRNIHYVAESIRHMQSFQQPWTIASIDTDGADYLSEAAGAIADQMTLEEAKKLDLHLKKYLKQYDTYRFFSRTGKNLIKTGYTGTNVGDVIVYLLG